MYYVTEHSFMPFNNLIVLLYNRKSTTFNIVSFVEAS